MTKSDLITRFAAKYPFLSVSNIEEIVDIFFGVIIDALKNNVRVELRGFGSFSTHIRDAITARNPKTGAKVFLKKRRIPFFRAGKFLKEEVNKKGTNFMEGI